MIAQNNSASDKELLDAYSNAVISVVEKVGSAVVQIKNNKKSSNFPFEGQGMGSGVIITPDGYVLTNKHVVDGGKDAEVSLTDGKSYKAEVVGADSGSDLALVRILDNSLPFAQLGNS